MAKDSVAIIDYGSGNLRSAAKAFEKVIADHSLNMDVILARRAEDLRTASRIVLPGQGAFGDCMRGLQAIPGMTEALTECVIQKARPFFGICVGMQLMASQGLEHGQHAGLGWIPGTVAQLAPTDKALKIPHMGWNELVIPSLPLQDNRHFVLRSAESSEHYYFVHSYVFECKYDHHILGMVDYGGLVPAMVGRDNMIGTQFHPEKSQGAGLKLIAEFLKWKP